MLAAAENPLPGYPLVESPLYDSLIEVAGFDTEVRRVADDLHANGFAVIDFPDTAFVDRAERIKSALLERPEFAEIAQIAPDHPVSAGGRLQDFTDNEDVRAIACNEFVIDLLTKLYGRQAFPFQTLNFAMGTEQHYHSDSVHFSSVPERFMVGVWVALEDIGPEQGPLIYYPGSHKWPVLHSDEVGHRRDSVAGSGEMAFNAAWRALVRSHNLEPQYFTPKKGQALIWAANLLHGGDAHHNRTKTRWSQVTHYLFEDCAYWTPLHSNPRVGRVKMRDVFDISTGKLVPNMYYGRPIDKEANLMQFAKDWLLRQAALVKRKMRH